jgi:hypothetical protein
MDETLADVIHDGSCGDMIETRGGKPHCRRYVKGNPHYDYYQEHAAELAERLEPMIGWANVLPVVRLLVGELC